MTASIAPAPHTRRASGSAPESTQPRPTKTPSARSRPGEGLLWAARNARLGASAAGLVVAATGRVLRLPPAPQAVEAAVSLASNQPWIRDRIEARVGEELTASALSLASTVAYTVTLSPARLSVDLGLQLLRAAERAAREQAWGRHLPGVVDGGGWPSRVRVPQPDPEGPGERHARRAATAQAVSTAAVGALTGSVEMASTAAVVASARTVDTTRAAFAATLGRRLADRDVAIPAGSASLLHLGDVSALVIDPRVLSGGGSLQVVRVRGVDDAELTPAWAQAQRLLGRRGVTPGWHPIPASGSTGSAGEALILPPQHRMATAVVTEARRAGLHLATVDLDILGELRPAFDHVRRVRRGIHGADAALAAEVTAQREKHRTVAVLAPAGSPALTGADLALALPPADGAAVTPESVATGIDVFLPDLAGVWQILHAIPAARDAERNGIAISTGASTLGGVLMVPGVRGWRGPAPTTVGAGAGLLAGFLLARRAAGTHAPRPAPAYRWHEMSPQQVREVLGQERLAAELTPAPEPSPPRGAWRYTKTVIEELDDPLTPLLMLCSAATALLGSPADASIVGGALVGNAMIAAGQRLRAEDRLSKLLDEQTPAARIVTGGEGPSRRYRMVPSDRLRPGDVIEVRANEVVPADARVLEDTDLEVDESALTGESLPVIKQRAATPGAELADRRCMAYAGTTVVTGTALAIVTAVGPDTQMRRAATLAGGDLPEIGLQRQLGKLVSRALPASFVGGGVVGLLGLLRGGGLQQALGNAIVVAVAAIPEGMPLMTTLAQFASARRLSGTGALVRVPRSVEALGRLDVVCFDKTGTLSQNRLRVTGVQLLDAAGGVDEAQVLDCAVQSVTVNAEHAHATDHAIIEAATAAGCRTAGADERDAYLPFRSGRAFSATVSGRRLSVKGAPEVILGFCDGGQSDLAEVRRTVTDLAGRGLRVIAVARRELTAAQAKAVREKPDTLVEVCRTGLTPVGLLSLADTIRDEAPGLLADLAERGIAVKLITGDHPITATAIAAELGMPVDAGAVITGNEWNELTRAQQQRAAAERTVFARMSPENKVQIVQSLTRAGQVCAMVGDGANDAAAIRAASVGVGVVSRGSDAAHTSSDIVLADGRIRALTEAIDEGRRLWRGVQAAVVGLLGGNAGEVAFTIIGSALTGNSPLNARQLLLMNMITDALPATAVAASTPAGPVRRASSSVDERALWRAVAVRGAITGTAGTAAWVLARLTGRPARAASVALIALVAMELGQMLVDSRAPLVVATSAGLFVTFAATMAVPGLSQLAAGSTPVGPFGWAIGLGAAGAGVVTLAALKGTGWRHALAVA